MKRTIEISRYLYASGKEDLKAERIKWWGVFSAKYWGCTFFVKKCVWLSLKASKKIFCVGSHISISCKKNMPPNMWRLRVYLKSLTLHSYRTILLRGGETKLLVPPNQMCLCFSVHLYPTFWCVSLCVHEGSFFFGNKRLL